MKILECYFFLGLLMLLPNISCQRNTDVINFSSEDLEKTRAIRKLENYINNKKILTKIESAIPYGSQEGDRNEPDCASITVDIFSPDIQSVVIVTESYQGPPGNTNVTTFTFNVKTGKVYKLSDLFKPKVYWAHLIWPYIQKALVSDGEKDTQEIGPDRNWEFSLSREELNLHFDFCNFLPCSKARTYTISIPLKDLSPHLMPEFSPRS